MIAEIFLNTVLFPLVLGGVLYVAAMVFKDRTSLMVLVAGLLSLGIYLLLEGVPALPPISSKHKVAIIIAGFVTVTFITNRINIPRFGIAAILLIAALIWLGWNRISDPSMLPRFLALIVPVLLATVAFMKFDRTQERGLIWPITLLCFAIGGSLISLLGAYIGFAQALGAMAAFIGSYILIAYISMILRPDRAHALLPEGANQIILLSMMTLLLVVGLFAPEVSPVALAVLGFTLLVPLFQARFDGANTLLKPLLIGLIAAIPTAASIAIAAL